MTTYSDKDFRVFRTESKERLARLRRKRSDGRLKSFNSNTDNRAWGVDEDERRRHILELIQTYGTTFGNYIPFEMLFKMLNHIADRDKTDMLDDALDQLKKVDKVLGKNDKLKQKLGKEREKQKQLSALMKCLEKSGGDLKKENKCLKDEIDRLNKRLAELEDALKKCQKKGGEKLPDAGPEKNPKAEQEVDRLEKELEEADRKIEQLVCELEYLQQCMEKYEAESFQMINVIEQQQAQLGCLAMLECQLHDVSKQRDILRCELENQGKNNASSCCTENSENLDNEGIACQMKEMENKLKCKDEEINGLIYQNQKQNECITQLQGLIRCMESDAANKMNSGGALSECCADNQQNDVILSQRKCLLEQHKYIVEQEQVRSNIQQRIRDHARREAELTYERDLLRNEIVFLTTRLKAYLGKIDMLEKSIDQFLNRNRCNDTGPPKGECPDMFPSTQTGASGGFNRPSEGYFSTDSDKQSGYGGGRGALSSCCNATSDRSMGYSASVTPTNSIMKPDHIGRFEDPSSRCEDFLGNGGEMRPPGRSRSSCGPPCFGPVIGQDVGGRGALSEPRPGRARSSSCCGSGTYGATSSRGFQQNDPNYEIPQRLDDSRRSRSCADRAKEVLKKFQHNCDGGH